MRAIAVSLIVVALSAQTVASDRSRGEWTAVVALQPGVSLEVERRPRLLYEGLLLVADADALVLDHAGERIAIPRDEIARVVRVGERLTARYAKRGFLVGAALGILQSLTVKSNMGWFLLVYPPLDGAVAAGIGAMDGARSRQRVIVYEVTTHR